MDQAVKSALNKYLGKPPKSTYDKNAGRSLVNILLIILIISSLLFFGVRYNVLGLREIWSEIKGITVGNQTVGQVVQNLKEAADNLFEIEYQTDTSETSVPTESENNGEVALTE
ncbi:MAG: hypothetical protein IJN42_06830 [Clostridia bacterium]|nr:hypothetical protein [Clostridia bacterium]